jgi:two-component system LytT family sensor kinase
LNPVSNNARWILPAAGLLAFAAYVYILHTAGGFNWSLSLKDGAVSLGLSSLALWCVMLIINAYPTRVGITLYAIAIASAISLLTAYASIHLQQLLFDKKDMAYHRFMHDTSVIRYVLTWLIFTWGGTYAALRKKTRELETKFKQQTDASTLLREAELYKLRQQLQPHFLYNSLNSISALTMIEPAKAQEMIGKLSDFLRSSIKREAQDMIPINEELLYIESYLSIESVRFGNRLQIVFEKDYVDDSKMPPFLLQPILENAIKFGLYGKTGEVTIRIQIGLIDSMLSIRVTNPFDNDSQAPRGTGFGLEGIRRRLYLLYARTDLLETLKEEDQFTTILKIPQQHVQGNTDR